MADHATMPFPLPPLDHLTTEEVGQLRARLITTSREARKKATQLLGRAPASLKNPWTRSLGMGKNTTPEERAAIQAELERELLRVPEAYLAHAWANSLILLDIHCRDELQRRTGSVNPRKKPLEPGPPKTFVVEPLPVPTKKPAAPADDEGEALDLSGMFDGGDDSV